MHEVAVTAGRVEFNVSTYLETGAGILAWEFLEVFTLTFLSVVLLFSFSSVAFLNHTQEHNCTLHLQIRIENRKHKVEGTEITGKF